MQRALFRRLSPAGQVPVRATKGSVGAQDTVIPANGRGIICTDVAVEIPSGFYGLIADRSGISLHYGITFAGGIIDQDYEDEIQVIVFNHGENDFRVNRGMLVAQLIFSQCSFVELIETVKKSDTFEGDISQEQAEDAVSTLSWSSSSKIDQPCGSAQVNKSRGSAGLGSTGLFVVGVDGRKQEPNKKEDPKMDQSDSDSELNKLIASIDPAKISALFGEAASPKVPKKKRGRKADH